jgi:putative transcriptional regulator
MRNSCAHKELQFHGVEDGFEEAGKGRIVMSSELYRELSKSIKEAGRIRRGETKPSRVFKYDAIDIRKLRESLDVSQSQFARMIGVSKDTLQNWEQGRRRPRGPAKALLRVFEKDPKAVVRALG